MSTEKAPARTPAGAYLYVRRGPRWTTIQLDRLPIADATSEQAATAAELSLAAARWCSTHGHPEAAWLAGDVVTSTVVPTADADRALAALIALEAHDHQPARALTRHYRAGPVEEVRRALQRS